MSRPINEKNLARIGRSCRFDGGTLSPVPNSRRPTVCSDRPSGYAQGMLSKRAHQSEVGSGESIPQEADDLVPISVEQLVNLTGCPNFSDRLQRAIGDAQSEGRLRLALDFRKVDRVCTAGLSELIAINSHARGDGLSVVLVNVQDEIREVFSLTRLERLFEFA